MENKFKESLLDKNTLSVTWELVPGRGATEKAQETAIASAEQAAIKAGAKSMSWLSTIKIDMHRLSLIHI